MTVMAPTTNTPRAGRSAREHDTPTIRGRAPAATGATSATALDLVRQGAVVCLAVAQIAAAYYVTQAGTDEFANAPPGGDPPIVPATYAFSIWGPIYASSVAYAVYQALPSQRTRAIHRDAGWWIALGYAGAASWILAAQEREHVIRTVSILMAIATAFGISLHQVVRHREALGEALPKLDRRLVVPMVGGFFGWTTVASFANIATSLRDSGITTVGEERASTLALLTVATGIVAWVERWSRGNAWYAGAVGWALVAAAYANVQGVRRKPDLVVAGASAVAAGLVVAATLWGRKQRPAR